MSTFETVGQFADAGYRALGVNQSDAALVGEFVDEIREQLVDLVEALTSATTATDPLMRDPDWDVEDLLIALDLGVSHMRHHLNVIGGVLAEYGLWSGPK